jgi:hypothetical protein
MKKIIYIAPHLSTGGLPQYLTKKIEQLKDVYEIYVVEYEDVTGGVLVIQKNKIKDLLGDNLITIPWGGDKQILIDTINIIKPDIVHLEEMPEYFMSDIIAKEIYKSDRKYKIFETSHDSSFNCERKRFQPDKFILVSNYQVDMLKDLNIPSEVVEYPIEYKDRPDRDEALIKLGLDPNYKHVLHVGLFTPRKNQKEFFEYAKQFESDKIIFHSLGNMADNFRPYWEPLIQNKPSNVVCHGEKSNVDDFYLAMDLFLFTSKGTITDKETMPLVIREAISCKIPTLIYNLPVYQNYFDTYDTINYLDFNSQNENTKKIADILYGKQNKTAVIISTYPKNNGIVDITLNSIKAIKEQGYDIILTSHAPVPEELQNEVNHVIYDSNNILTYHDYYTSSWIENDKVKMFMNIKTEGNHIYHGPAVYTNYYNGINYAKNLGYDNTICFNFDMVISDTTIIPKLIDDLKYNKAVYNHTVASEGNALRTVLFATRVDFFMENFSLILNDIDYNNWKNDIGSESNGLENMFYHTLKDSLAQIKILNDNDFYKMLSNCSIDICSMVEYFNILPIKDNKNQFAIWYSTSNKTDDRDVSIVISRDNVVTDIEDLTVKTSQSFYKVIDNNSSIYDIKLYENGSLKKSITIDQEYINNKLKNNGELIIK